MEGADDPVGRSSSCEHAEQVGHRSADLLVGIQRDLAGAIVDVADGERAA
jgi:hypothetical protein